MLPLPSPISCTAEAGPRKPCASSEGLFQPAAAHCCHPGLVNTLASGSAASSPSFAAGGVGQALAQDSAFTHLTSWSCGLEPSAALPIPIPVPNWMQWLLMVQLLGAPVHTPWPDSWWFRGLVGAGWRWGGRGWLACACSSAPCPIPPAHSICAQARTRAHLPNLWGVALWSWGPREPLNLLHLEGLEVPHWCQAGKGHPAGQARAVPGGPGQELQYQLVV